MENIQLLLQGKIPLRILHLPKRKQTVWHMAEASGVNKLEHLNKTAQICAFTELDEELFTSIGASPFNYTYMLKLTADVHFTYHSDLFTKTLSDGTRYIHLMLIDRVAFNPLMAKLVDIVRSHLDLPEDMKTCKGYMFLKSYLTESNIQAIISEVATIDFEKELHSVTKPGMYNELIVSNCTIEEVYKATGNAEEAINFPIIRQVTLKEAKALVTGRIEEDMWDNEQVDFN